MTIKIEKELFQWEKGRQVIIETQPDEPIITILEFYNANSKIGEAEVLEEGIAYIPDYLLKTAKPIIILACTGEKGNTKPISRRCFKVIPRPVPEGYVDEYPELPTGTHIICDGGEEL